jgi:hypothetical protein
METNRSRALRLSDLAAEYRDLVKRFGGSPALREKADRLTLEARAAWTAL